MADKKIITGTDFIKAELKQGLTGAYFFYGAEDYMKQFYLHEAEKSVVGTRESLKFIRITNDEFTPDTLYEALTSTSMADFFSMDFNSDSEDNDGKRLIELYEVDFKSLKPTEFANVCTMIKEKLTEDTVLIIYATESEMPEDSSAHKTLIRDLSKIAKTAKFSHETDAKLCSWLIKLAAKQKITLSSELARVLLDRVGHNMLLLKNESEKLCSFVAAKQKNVVTNADIIAVVCKNKEISPFDFTNALMRRDAKSAFFILEDMKAHSEEPIVILSTVSRVVNELISVRGYMDRGMMASEISAVTKMHEYRVKLYMQSLKTTDISDLFTIAAATYNADVMMKSSACDSFVILERLICELAGVR